MMKKGQLMSFFLLFIFSLVFFKGIIHAEVEKRQKKKMKKQINIFGTFGMATSQLEEALLDFGVEFQLTQGFYFRIIANTHLGNDRHYNDYYYPDYTYDYYYSRLGFSNGSVLHGLSLYGAYKFLIAKNLRFFLQMGFNYLSFWEWESNPVYFMWGKYRRRGYGIGFGPGFEYFFSDRLGILIGGTYRALLEEQQKFYPDEPAPGKPSWLKIYLGLTYRAKGF